MTEGNLRLWVSIEERSLQGKCSVREVFVAVLLLLLLQLAEVAATDALCVPVRVVEVPCQQGIFSDSWVGVEFQEIRDLRQIRELSSLPLSSSTMAEVKAKDATFIFH